MRKISAALLGLVATVAAVVAFAAPVGAAPGPGCPTGDGAAWFLAPVSAALPAVDTGNWDDQNGDGLACARVNKGQSAKNAFESWTWKDNS